jgi:O-antigen/teichoic acid export membrane protein
LIRRLAINGAAQVSALLVSLADRIVLVALFLRVWGVEIYSDYLSLLAMAGLLAATDLGLQIYFGNLLQKAHGERDDAQFQRIVGICTYIYLWMAAFYAALTLGFFAAFDLRDTLNLLRMSEGEAAAVFLLLGFHQISRLARGSISQIYRGRGTYGLGLFVGLAPLAAGLLAALIAVWAGGGPVLVCALYAATDIVFGWALMAWHQKRRFSGLSYAPLRPTRAEVQALQGHWVWLAIASVTPALWLQAPVLIISQLGLSGAPLIAFTLARTLAGLIRQTAQLATLNFGVEFAQEYHAGRKEAVEANLLVFGRVLAVASISLAAGLFAFGEPLVRQWTGREALFDPWLMALVLLPPAIMAQMLPVSGFLLLTNRPAMPAAVNLVQLGTGFLAAVVLGYQWGVVGVAAGLALGEFAALNVLLPYLAARHYALPMIRHVTLCSATAGVAGAWSFAAASALLWLTPDGSRTAEIAAMAAWAIAGAFVPVAAALPRRHRARLTAIALRPFGRPGA